MTGNAGLLVVFMLSLAGLVAVAQPQADAPGPGAGKASSLAEFAGLSAREVVREGNRRLIEGEAGGALGAYDHAAKLLPGAREIAFARGLANFDLKKFDEARAAFERVAVEGTDAPATGKASLLVDAQYGIGVTDHVEALENTDNPEMAISLLESAMRRYHRVLAEDPNHKGARDANFKAASVWRRIRQMQEQQQQSEKNDKDGDEQEKSDENKNQSGSDDKRSDQEQTNQQQQEAESSDKQDEKKAEQQSAQQKEQEVSQEQAQRQLREMMQALRERKKARQAQIIKMPVAPVDKDW